MGTPCACIYATMFFAWFKRQIILTKYIQNLIIYKRQIDDILGIWIPDPNNTLTFNDFKSDLNKMSKLTWVTSDLSYEVNFLDLTLKIAESGQLVTRT